MAPKAAPTHAPYVDMIKAAVVALKDRNGSSLPALKKKIGKCRLSYSGLLFCLISHLMDLALPRDDVDILHKLSRECELT